MTLEEVLDCINLVGQLIGGNIKTNVLIRLIGEKERGASCEAQSHWSMI